MRWLLRFVTATGHNSNINKFMVAFISGKLVSKNPTQVIIESGGFGFEVNISLNTYKNLGEVSSTVYLLLHLHVREDLLQLYGFHALEEKKLFLKLISISGIGTKMAQVILSSATVREFIDSILAEDLSSLTRIPGIGKKTAQRLIFDLKDRITIDMAPEESEGVAVRIQEQNLDEEALMALISLGYSKQNAETAIKRVRQKYTEPLSLEELIKLSLQGVG